MLRLHTQLKPIAKKCYNLNDLAINSINPKRKYCKSKPPKNINLFLFEKSNSIENENDHLALLSYAQFVSNPTFEFHSIFI